MVMFMEGIDYEKAIRSDVVQLRDVFQKQVGAHHFIVFLSSYKPTVVGDFPATTCSSHATHDTGGYKDVTHDGSMYAMVTWIPSIYPQC